MSAPDKTWRCPEAPAPDVDPGHLFARQIASPWWKCMRCGQRRLPDYGPNRQPGTLVEEPKGRGRIRRTPASHAGANPATEENAA